MTYNNFNTVQEALDGDVTLVGEEHFNPRSGDLMDEVLDDVEPRTVAIELERPRDLGGGGMSRAVKYARREGAPVLGIDDKDTWRGLGEDTSGLLSVANHFAEPVGDNGDVPEISIVTARQRVRKEYGERVHNAMYVERERAMAGRLRRAVDEFETPIVAGIGAFHILALKAMLENLDNVIEIAPRRARSNAAPSTTEETATV